MAESHSLTTCIGKCFFKQERIIAPYKYKTATTPQKMYRRVMLCNLTWIEVSASSGTTSGFGQGYRFVPLRKDIDLRLWGRILICNKGHWGKILICGKRLSGKALISMMSQRWVVFQLFAELLCSAKLILEIEMEHNLQLTKEKRESEDIRYVICAYVLDLICQGRLPTFI